MTKLFNQAARGHAIILGQDALSAIFLAGIGDHVNQTFTPFDLEITYDIICRDTTINQAGYRSHIENPVPGNLDDFLIYCYYPFLFITHPDALPLPQPIWINLCADHILPITHQTLAYTFDVEELLSNPSPAAAMFWTPLDCKAASRELENMSLTQRTADQKLSGEKSFSRVGDNPAPQKWIAHLDALPDIIPEIEHNGSCPHLYNQPSFSTENLQVFAMDSSEDLEKFFADMFGDDPETPTTH